MNYPFAAAVLAIVLISPAMDEVLVEIVEAKPIPEGAWGDKSAAGR